MYIVTFILIILILLIIWVIFKEISALRGGLARFSAELYSIKKCINEYEIKKIELEKAKFEQKERAKKARDLRRRARSKSLRRKFANAETGLESTEEYDDEDY